MILLFLYILISASNISLMAMKKPTNPKSINPTRAHLSFEKKHVYKIIADDMTTALQEKHAFHVMKTEQKQTLSKRSQSDISSIDPAKIDLTEAIQQKNLLKLESITRKIDDGNLLIQTNNVKAAILVFEGVLNNKKEGSNLLRYIDQSKLTIAYACTINAQLNRRATNLTVETIESIIDGYPKEERSSIRRYTFIKAARIIYNKGKEADAQQKTDIANKFFKQASELLKPITQKLTLAQQLHDCILYEKKKAAADKKNKTNIHYLHNQLIKYYQLITSSSCHPYNRENIFYAQRLEEEEQKNLYELQRKEYETYLNCLESLSSSDNIDAQSLIIQLYRDGKYVKKSPEKIIEHCTYYLTSLYSQSKLPQSRFLISSTLQAINKEECPAVKILEKYFNLFCARIQHDTDTIDAILDSMNQKINPLQFYCMDLMFKLNGKVRALQNKILSLTPHHRHIRLLHEADDTVTIQLLQQLIKKKSIVDPLQQRIYNYILGLYFYKDAMNKGDFSLANEYFKQCPSCSNARLLPILRTITESIPHQDTDSTKYKEIVHNVSDRYTFLLGQINPQTKKPSLQFLLKDIKKLVSIHAQKISNIIITQCMKLNDYQTIVIFFEHIDRLDPHATYPLVTLKKLLDMCFNNTDTDDATTDFQKTLLPYLESKLLSSNTSDDQKTELIEVIGNFCYQLGTKIKSIKLLNKAIEYKNTRALYEQAMLLLKSNLSLETVDLICKLLDKDIELKLPHSIQALNELAQFYYRNPQAPHSIRKRCYHYLTKETNCHNDEFAVPLAQLYLHGIQEEDGSWYLPSDEKVALSLLANHINTCNNNWTQSAHYTQGIIFFKKNDLFRSLRAFQKSIQYTTNNEEKISAFCYMSSIMLMLETDVTALAYLHKARTLVDSINEQTHRKKVNFSSLANQELWSLLSKKSCAIIKSKDTSTSAQEWITLIPILLRTMEHCTTNLQTTKRKCFLYALENIQVKPTDYLNKKADPNQTVTYLSKLQEIPKNKKQIDIAAMRKLVNAQYSTKDNNGFYYLTAIYPKEKYEHINTLQAYFNLFIAQLLYDEARVEKMLNLTGRKINPVLHACLKMIFLPNKNIPQLCKSMLQLTPDDKNLIQFCQNDDGITIPYLEKLIKTNMLQNLHITHAFNYLLGLYYFRLNDYSKANAHLSECLLTTPNYLSIKSLYYATLEPFKEGEDPAKACARLLLIQDIVDLLSMPIKQDGPNKQQQQSTINALAKIGKPHEFLLEHCINAKDHKNSLLMINFLHILNPKFEYAKKFFMLLSDTDKEAEENKKELLSAISSSVTHKNIIQAIEQKTHSYYCCTSLAKALLLNQHLDPEKETLLEYIKCALSHSDLPDAIRTDFTTQCSKLAYQLGIQKKSIPLLDIAFQCGNQKALYAKAKFLSEKNSPEEKKEACALFEQYIENNPLSKNVAEAIDRLLLVYISLSMDHQVLIDFKKFYTYASLSYKMGSCVHAISLALSYVDGVKKKDDSWLIPPDQEKAHKILRYIIKHGTPAQQALAYFRRGLNACKKNRLLQSYRDFGKCVAISTVIKDKISSYMHMGIILFLMECNTKISPTIIRYLKSANNLLEMHNEKINLLDYLSNQTIFMLINEMNTLLHHKKPDSEFIKLCFFIGKLLYNSQPSISPDNDPLHNYVKECGKNYILHAAHHGLNKAISYVTENKHLSDNISLIERIYLDEQSLENTKNLIYPTKIYDWCLLLDYDCNKKNFKLFEKHIKKFYEATIDKTGKKLTSDQISTIQSFFSGPNYLTKQISSLQTKMKTIKVDPAVIEQVNSTELASLIFFVTVCDLSSTIESILSKIEVLKELTTTFAQSTLLTPSLNNCIKRNIGRFYLILAFHYYNSSKQSNWETAFNYELESAKYEHPSAMRDLIFAWLGYYPILPQLCYLNNKYPEQWKDFKSKNITTISIDQIKKWANFLKEKKKNNPKYQSIFSAVTTKLNQTKKQHQSNQYENIPSIKEKLQKIDITPLVQSVESTILRSTDLFTYERALLKNRYPSLFTLATQINPLPEAALLLASKFSNGALSSEINLDEISSQTEQINLDFILTLLSKGFEYGVTSINASSYRYFISQEILAQLLFIANLSTRCCTKKSSALLILNTIKSLLAEYNINVAEFEKIYSLIFQNNLVNNLGWRSFQIFIMQ